MKMNNELLMVLKGIHRELVVANHKMAAQKKKQRKLFQLLDNYQVLSSSPLSDPKIVEDTLNQIAKLVTEGFVKA